ncbi:hypothetical protein [Agarivorans sp. QJM3NY_33]|uniref:hypothetical protein n=1 Tax=Agarivorans sp. QJM3NY_33 TaxID=3421432 RepID=UPI003D7ED5D8
MKIADYDNLLCKIFSSEVADFNQKELKVLMVKLLDHFPYIQKDEDNKEIYDVDNKFAKKWYAAYNHLILLMDFKKQDYRHTVSVWLSSSALLISVVAVIANILAK